MTKNPIVNAITASSYIMLVVSIMNYIMETQGSKPDPAYAPMIFISMLTLSVAIMGYLFFFQPLQFLIDGKKKEAINLFVQTVAVFAAVSLIAAMLIFSGVI